MTDVMSLSLSIIASKRAKLGLMRDRLAVTINVDHPQQRQQAMKRQRPPSNLFRLLRVKNKQRRGGDLDSATRTPGLPDVAQSSGMALNRRV